MHADIPLGRPVCPAPAPAAERLRPDVGGLAAAPGLLLLLSVLALLGALPPNALGKPPDYDRWRTLETPRFTLISDMGDFDTLRLANRINQLVEAMSPLLRVDEKRLHPLTLVLFSDQDEYKRYAPKPPSEWYYSASFMEENLGSFYGAVFKEYDEKETQVPLLHDCARWYMAGLTYPVPRAVLLGTAEAFSTMDMGTSTIVFGEPLKRFERTLMLERSIPVADLLADPRPGSLEKPQWETYDAECWALVHYMIFSDAHLNNGALGRFLDVCRRGASPAQALVAALGADDAGHIDATLSSYESQRSFAELRVHLRPSGEIRQAVRPADPYAVECALAALSVGKHPDEALAHVTAAAALQPSRPEAYDLLAVLFNRLNRPDADIARACAQALKCGSRKGSTYFLDARSARRMAMQSVKLSGPQARDIVNEAELAIRYQPTLEPAFTLLANVIGASPRVTPDDGKFLAFGRRQFPNNSAVVLGLAVVAEMKGDRAAADSLRREAAALPAAD